MKGELYIYDIPARATCAPAWRVSITKTHVEEGKKIQTMLHLEHFYYHSEADKPKVLAIAIKARDKAAELHGRTERVIKRKEAAEI